MPFTSIQSWLNQLGMSQYEKAFETNDVDIDVLVNINDQALKDIGISSVGHRIKLLKAIAEIRSGQTTVPSSKRMDEVAALESTTNLEGERRQLTVLFCDMVGFTELANRVDPEVLQGIIHRYEDTCAVCITRYDGYVFQRLGDGIVAFFGYPLAHEGEAERAIHAGLSIIDSLSRLDVVEVGRLQARIGIAIGVVVVSGAERRAVGETMNLASRLQGIAPVGGIVVSERVRRLARGVFEYDDLGEQTLKGMPKPTPAFRIVAVSQAASRFEAATQEGLTPMVGREQEIGSLLKRWALAQNGEGQAVLLSGEPGIGKSRVLSTLCERLEVRGAQVLRFQSSPYHVSSAYYPIIDNFERALKFGRDEPPDSKLDKLEALMVDRFGLPYSEVRLVAGMLSIPCETRYGKASMTPQKDKDETLRVLAAIVEAAARKQPTALLYEDAHWADPTTLEVLELIIERLGTIPMLVVLTHRPGFDPKWRGDGHVATLNLARLKRVQSSAIVSKLTRGKVLPADLLDKILAETDGVPLYVEELTTAILESGELQDAGDHYTYAGAARNVTIPASLRDSLMARLDRLMHAKEIAKIGAAIGREFSYELIAAVAPYAKAELDIALKQLTESGLAFRRGTLPGATYVFKHALVQDVAYDSLLKSRRQTLHAKIAHALAEHFPNTKDTEPELLAHHLTAAGETELAIDYWRAAGKLALKRFALNEAISHLNKGTQIIDTLQQSPQRDEKELSLRILLGRAWVALRGFGASEAWSSFHTALGLAKSLSRHEALLPIYFGLCSNLVIQGRLAEGLGWVNEMLASAESTGDPDLLIMGHRSACTTYFWLGQFDQSREHGDRVLALYNEEKHRHLAEITNVDPMTIVDIYRSIGTWMLGYPDRAVQVSEAMEAHARRRGHPFDLGYALTFGVQVWDLLREPEPLLARVEEAERLGRAHGLPFISEVLAQMFKGTAWLRAGRLAEGVPQLCGTLQKWNTGGALLLAPYLRTVLAEGLALSGDLEGGLSLIEESLAQIARPGWEERSHLAEVLRLKGWILQRQGKLAAAEENYLASLDVAREQRARSWELRTSTSLARLWQSQGKRKEAVELLAAVYNWFTEGFTAKDLLEAKALLVELL